MFSLYLHLVNYISAFANVSSYILQICMYSHFCSRFTFANAKSNSFVIRYPSAYVYMHTTLCHNLARSAFFSIQSARRFSTCSLLSRRVHRENRGDLRSMKRKQEAGIAVRKAAAVGSIKRIKAANREAKGRHRPGFSSFLSSCARLVHSPLASYSKGKTVESPYS